ncbi:hypothetical protein [Methanonatronarchaeum thermophilum]|uniref:hypothetical protein n=1 Tax=Methanonatronarchaeum thermophilum TaxID=1927129 RepID=UPI00117ABB7D|nr:hypothetical protein [Methanonatronarchaeum thermophilum]
MIVELVFDRDVKSDPGVYYTDCSLECLRRSMELGEIMEFKLVCRDNDGWFREDHCRSIYIDMKSVKSISVLRKENLV